MRFWYNVIISVQEIETAIVQLPPADVEQLAAWLDEFRAQDLDALSAEDAATVRAGIARGMTDCDAGRAMPAAEWAASLRRELHLPSHLSDSELAQ